MDPFQRSANRGVGKKTQVMEAMRELDEEVASTPGGWAAVRSVCVIERNEESFGGDEDVV